MAAPPSPDLMQRALVGEAAIAANPKIAATDAYANAIITRVNETNWKQAAEMGKRPVTEPKNVNERIEEIGINRNPTTLKKDRQGAEKVRHDKATKASKESYKLLMNGYDKLTPIEKTAIEDKVISAAQKDPRLAIELFGSGSSDSIRREWARGKLKDPRYANELASVLEGIGDPSKALGNEVSMDEEKVEDAKLEMDNKKLDLDDIQRQIDFVDTQVKLFDRTGAPAAWGAKAKELKQLIDERPLNEGQLKLKQASLVTAKQDVADAEHERMMAFNVRDTTANPTARQDAINAAMAKLGPARTSEMTLTNEVSTLQEKINKIKELEDEESQAHANKTPLEAQKREKQLAFDKTKKDWERRQKGFEDAKALRESHEQDLVDSLEGAIGKAATAVTDQDAEALLTSLNAENEARKGEAATADEQAMWDGLNERWLGPVQYRGLFRKKPYRPLNRATIDTDYGALMTQGPQESMINLLVSRGYTRADAEGLLTNKAEGSLYNKMEPEVVKRLLANRMLSGGISQEEVRTIVFSKWGRGMIEESIKLRAEVFENDEKLKAVGALGGPGFWDRLATEAGRSPWWLMLLLGAIGTFATPLGPLGVAAGGGAALGGMSRRAASPRFATDLAA